MACFSGPNIVTDGLILSFDAASLRSVPKTNILSGWTDYNSGSAHYEVIGDHDVKLLSTSNNWVGNFPATVSSTGKYIITFTYYADSDGSSLVLDNDGIHNNVYNTTVTANISPQTYTGSYDVTSTGSISHFFRRSSGGNIFVTDVSYFKLETTCTDTSGSGNTGTLTNGTSYDNSNVGSFVFDGSNDHISGSVNNPSGDWVHSIEFWMYMNQNQSAISSRQDPFTIGTPTTSRYSAVDISNNNFNLYFYSNDCIVNTTNLFVANTWYHIGLTYAGGGATNTNKKLYINGVNRAFDTSGSANLNIPANATVNIGRDGGRNTAYFNGRISNFKIYNNKALTAAEVKQNFNALRDRYGI